MTEKQESKRDFLKKSAYVVPTILTLRAIPMFAGSGSARAEKDGFDNSQDPQMRGNPRMNEGAGSRHENRGRTYKKLGRKGRA